MKRRNGLALAVLFSLLLTASAQASLPKAHSTLIVPFKSLAGLKLNSSLASASRAWGKGGICGESGCNYISKSGGTAHFLLAQRSTTAPLLVVDISIEAPLASATSTKRNFKTPLAAYKTSSGIGIGSSAKGLKHAYRHLEKEAADFYILKGPGESSMSFILSEGRISTVSMASVHLG